MLTFSVGIEAGAIEPLLVAEPVAPAVPAVPVAPVAPVPAVPAVLPGVVEPVLVMLPAFDSIVPVTSTFWFTYSLSLTVDPAFSISVLCAPMVAVEPVLPVVPVVPVAAEPVPVSIFVSMNPPTAPAVPVAPAVVPGVVAPVVLGVVLPIELALEGTRHPVTVMVLPACALGVVCAGGVVGEVDGGGVL